jgi:hypothetical protein
MGRHRRRAPRISRDFLEEERRSLPASVFVAEYMCEFSDTLESVFASEDVRDTMSDDIEPLFDSRDGYVSTHSVVVPLFSREAAS